MTGKARQHEIRILGLTLAAVAVLAAVVSLWAASSLLHRLQAPVSGGTPVTQARVGLVDQG